MQILENEDEVFENFDLDDEADDAEDLDQPQYNENRYQMDPNAGLSDEEEVDGRTLQNDTGGSRHGTEHESNDDDSVQ